MLSTLFISTYIKCSYYIMEYTCTLPCAATIPVEAGSSLTGSLEEGGLVRYELQVPPHGLSLNICVSQGEILIYGSSVVPNPNSALNDFNLTVNATTTPCVNITIDESASVSETAKHESTFVLIEGLDSTNDYTIVVSASEPPEDNNDRGSGEPDVTYPTEGRFELNEFKSRRSFLLQISNALGSPVY